ncbi:hypothetical protein [Sediminicurvatus halobius]|uniref:Uncharacterized protein n=1 Tax=Sediminicurvatus halobius TaxID=2182432 RepID=A0A2U2MXQ9_9GAMM|nr:hypothetical protein [Spiribacter halobius]PWG61736.1 hypothetical protein DEM34_14820 [Spiribacter halobius]UEX76834.1 hypothetical protein LMH63_12800 [Spiribacter halobius]
MTGKQIDDSGVTTTQVRQVMLRFEDELEIALQEHPGFPDDPIHQVAIVCEESGEALRAAIQSVYEHGPEAAVDKELVQTAAMCIRALIARRLQRGAEE